MDNPIYEPKKKETDPDDGDSAAAPLEVDGVDPASNTYVSSRVDPASNTYVSSCFVH